MVLVVAVLFVDVPTLDRTAKASVQNEPGVPSRGEGGWPTGAVSLAGCPWLQSAMSHHNSSASLAALVLARMTLHEKLGEIVLSHAGGYENFNAGVPRLCIPSLTLQDGPAGLAFGDTNVTQLPAPLGIAATFDTSTANAYGQVLGSEAHGQGIDVLQGPNLNIDRVPQNGRAYEGFGEDPLLVSSMGVADITGIQSQGVMAQAKHLVVYNQETNRGALNTTVSQRTLHEIYLPPFKAAVRQAHVASVMCAYPQLNGTLQCQDPQLVQLLDRWGFAGFVRSDLAAAHDPAVALTAGTDLLKPEDVSALNDAVRNGSLSLDAVDAAVLRVLTDMFAHGLVGQPPTGVPGTAVDSPAHAAFALHAAEQSAVLLQNGNHVLPLATRRMRSLAVIGADASTVPVTAGFGSSHVTAPFVSTPLAAIRQRAGPGVNVTYSDGGSTTRPLPVIPSSSLTPASGTGHGLTLTVAQNSGVAGSRVLQSVDPVPAATIRVNPFTIAMKPPGVAPQEHPAHAHPGAGAASAAYQLGTRLVLPPGWSGVTATWTGTLTPPRTGLYSLSLSGSGGARLTLDGKTAVSDPYNHSWATWSQTTPLVAGHPYQVTLTWEPMASLPGANTGTGSGPDTAPNALTPSNLQLGWEYATGPIAAAVAAARSARTTVVFAGDFSAEGYDKPSLSLPGDQNALISAVAAANPRTVVVLNTGGPVLMPWLASVSGVIEAWYPGEQDGAAIAALLFGDVGPSGRLPVTFPASMTQSAVNSPAQWPGVNLNSSYSEQLDVGYRYDNAHGIHPLFPFGYGLSYTGFALRDLAAVQTGHGYTLSVDVTNTGRRAGTAVPQAYVTFPSAAGEPPRQLVAFKPVALRPGETTLVRLIVPPSAFTCYLSGAWTTVPGTYTLSVGESSSDLPLQTSVPIA